MAISVNEAQGRSDKNAVRTPSLDSFGVDLTAQATHGKLEPVIGRTSEIQRCCQILSRKKKNNPLLIGEAGVGKTQIAQGIAQKIADKKVAKLLQNKRIILLDLAAVVAGTTLRGEFEDRMKRIVQECAAAKNIILFIDEIHTMVGAGSASGSMDAANIIKPALADGSLQLIGATTLKEYRESMEDDGALVRRFQNVQVNPSSVEDTLIILKGLKPSYEKFHKVTYSDEALEACVTLSDRFITDRALPDKAIDLMDEAGAQANAILLQDGQFEMPTELKELHAKFNSLEQQKAELMQVQEYEAIIPLRDEARRVKVLIEKKKEEWENEVKRQNNFSDIGLTVIQKIVHQITGVPVTKMGEQDFSELQKMKPNLLSSVIGQDEAVIRAVKAVYRAKLGLKKPNRPISFMFIGSTGTGKTHLAKGLAKELFGSDENFFKFDMSEYSQEHTVSRLIGAPPGFVGYHEGGELTEKVRRKPWSIILFDEIEKAHWSIYNLLLQALEDGVLTDGLKRKCSLKNCIFIFTSNVGARTLRDFGDGVGFATRAKQQNKQQVEESILKKELENKFAPEFINRLDEIVYFNTLEREDILKIAKIEINEAIARIEKLNITVDYEMEVVQFIAERGYDKEMGARPMYRTIQKYIDDLIATDVIEQNIKEGNTITLRVQNESLMYEINKKQSTHKNHNV